MHTDVVELECDSFLKGKFSSDEILSVIDTQVSKFYSVYFAKCVLC
jgi:hypothetical protein